MPDIAERAFEDAIVHVLVSGRPEGASGGCAGEAWPGYEGDGVYHYILQVTNMPCTLRTAKG